MGPTVWLVGRGGYPLATWLPLCLSFSHRHLKQLEGSKRWATDLTCASPEEPASCSPVKREVP